eukprot:1792698-Rhodomonas_salina.3
MTTGGARSTRGRARHYKRGPLDLAHVPCVSTGQRIANTPGLARRINSHCALSEYKLYGKRL